MTTKTLSLIARLACAVCAGAALASCSPESAPAALDIDASVPASAEAAGGQVRSEAWKFERLVACHKQADERAHAAVARYLDWVGDRRHGPTGLETRVLGIPELPAAVVDHCSDQLHVATTEGPPMRELDGAARVYLAALRDLSMQILPLHRYYQREGYKDDGFAHGRALHGRVMEAARQFRHASDAFSRKLDHEGERLLLARLADQQDGGLRDAGYYRMALVFDGRRLVRLLESDSFDAHAAQRQLDAFERIAEGAAAFRSPDGTAPPGMSLVTGKAAVFLKVARARAGGLEIRRPGGRADAARLPGYASRDKLRHAYNELAEAANST